jgi:hypothetical protein
LHQLPFWLLKLSKPPSPFLLATWWRIRISRKTIFSGLLNFLWLN